MKKYHDERETQLALGRRSQAIDASHVMVVMVPVMPAFLVSGEVLPLVLNSF